MSGAAPDLYAMPLRERIRWLRLHSPDGKISHDRLGEKLGTSRQTVIGWENGSRPKPPYVKKLAAYFGQPEDLFEAPIEEAVTLSRLADRLEELEVELEKLRPLLGRVGDLQEQLDGLALRVDSAQRPGRGGTRRGGSGAGGAQ